MSGATIQLRHPRENGNLMLNNSARHITAATCNHIRKNWIPAFARMMNGGKSLCHHIIHLTT